MLLLINWLHWWCLTAQQEQLCSFLSVLPGFNVSFTLTHPSFCSSWLTCLSSSTITLRSYSHLLTSIFKIGQKYELLSGKYKWNIQGSPPAVMFPYASSSQQEMSPILILYYLLLLQQLLGFILSGCARDVLSILTLTGLLQRSKQCFGPGSW